MGNVTAEQLAAEFIRILGEGWKPDLDEFLGRVPAAHREDCRRHIEQLAQRSGLGFAVRPAEPEPVSPENGASEDGIGWIEQQVSEDADDTPFEVVAEAEPEPEPALAVEENRITGAVAHRNPESKPVVRVRRAIDELWGQVGPEDKTSEAAPAPAVKVLSVAEELANVAAAPARKPAPRKASGRSRAESTPRRSADEAEPQPISGDEAMEMWRVQRRMKRPRDAAPLR